MSGLELMIYAINGMACCVTAVTLYLFDKKTGVQFFNRLMMYCIIVASGAIAISSAFGTYPVPETQQVILNVFIAALVVRSRGRASQHFVINGDLS